MPRANRYHVPGLVWHITHRCHNREYLLRFKLYRDRYRDWLYEAKGRYGLCLLNYNLTSNHIHLIVFDSGKPDVIEKSMQLAQGRLAQEYNLRKRRTGAFWQDRYHATAVQTGKHLRNCFTYVDMNMVRAGAVTHPSEWANCGYQEIQQPPKRCRLLDLERTAALLSLSGPDHLAAWQEERIIQAIAKPSARNPIWHKSVAVGDETYLEGVMQRLGFRARFKKVVQADNAFYIQETAPESLYLSRFQSRQNDLSG